MPWNVLWSVTTPNFEKIRKSTEFFLCSDDVQDISNIPVVSRMLTTVYETSLPQTKYFFTLVSR